MSLKEKIFKNEIAIAKIFSSCEEKDKAYNVYLVPVDELKLNPFNGRFRSTAHDSFGIEKISLNNLELSEETKAKYLKESLPTKYKELEKSINMNGQNDPVFLNDEGVVADGNSRLVAMRSLGKKTIKAVFLNSNPTTQSEIEEMETKIQFAKNSKVPYTPLNREIKIVNMFNKYIKDKKSSEVAKKEIANLVELTKGEVSLIIKKYEMIENTFKTINKPFKYSWFDQTGDQFKTFLSLLSSTFETKSSLSKQTLWIFKECNSEELEKYKKDFILCSILFISLKPKAVGGTRNFFKVKNAKSLVSNKVAFINFINFIKTELTIDRILQSLDSDSLFKPMKKRVDEYMEQAIQVGFEQMRKENSATKIMIKKDSASSKAVINNKIVFNEIKSKAEIDLAAIYLNNAINFIIKAKENGIKDIHSNLIEKIKNML